MYVLAGAPTFSGPTCYGTSNASGSHASNSTITIVLLHDAKCVNSELHELSEMKIK